MENTDQQLPPNPMQPVKSVPAINQTPLQTPPNSRRYTKFTIFFVIMLFLLGSGTYLVLSKNLFQQKSSQPATPTSITITSTPSSLPIVDPTANWKTYTDSKTMFILKYPLTLYVKGAGQQFYLAKQDATDAEKIDYSDEMVEIRLDTAVDRFESYYNTPDNIPVKNHGDVKLKSYYIDGYKAILYGYLDEEKKKEMDTKEEVVKSGASVGMVYFNRGALINKDGIIISLSTNKYRGDFKNTFDQILSTFKFAGEELSSDPSSPLDTKKCKVGEKRTLLHGLGSKRIEITGKQSSNCILSYKDEVEGGYTIYDCIIPPEVKEVTVQNLDLGKYCKEVKSGNMFLDNQR